MGRSKTVQAGGPAHLLAATQVGDAQLNHSYFTRQQNAEPLPIEVLSVYPPQLKENKSFAGYKRSRHDGSLLNNFAKKTRFDHKSTVFIEPGMFSPKSERNFSTQIQTAIPSHRPANFALNTPRSGKPALSLIHI